MPLPPDDGVMAPEFVMMLLLTASMPVSTLLMGALLVMMLTLPARMPDDCGPAMGAVLLMWLLFTPELSKNVKVSKDEPTVQVKHDTDSDVSAVDGHGGIVVT